MTSTSTSPGRLTVVATPIGNLDDMSRRALDALSEATVIAAEDTRRTRGLLSHFGLKKPLFTLNDINETEAASTLLRRLRAGECVALVSDAGTPLINDPGFRTVREAINEGIEVVSVPGPSAVTAALVVSGLPSERFRFEGFLPARDEGRRAAIERLATADTTLIFFESVHRLPAGLAALSTGLGAERRAAVCRELTKRYETIYRGTLGELAAAAADGELTLKGEFVIVVEGKRTPAPADSGLDRLLSALLTELPLTTAVPIAVAATGEKRNTVYQRALALTKAGL